MVNEGDLNGRRAANVVAVRAAFVDLDEAPLTVLDSSPVPPHIVIESSPDRFHAYWRVTGCPVNAFTPLQKDLAARGESLRSAARDAATWFLSSQGSAIPNAHYFVQRCASDSV